MPTPSMTQRVAHVEHDGPPAGHDYQFTVLTPTFNRAHTLGRAYQSLVRQTFRDFEWIVIDDGSTDGTAELVEALQAAASFPIIYARQENRGKGEAVNHGVGLARGELTAVLDSDDACTPHALERFHAHWTSLPPDERSRFAGLTALCMDESGRIVGDSFPADVFDSDGLEMQYRFRAHGGEKWMVHRTEVLRQFPFPPRPPGSRSYIPETLVWDEVARRYRCRYVNEPLRIYHCSSGSDHLGTAPLRTNAFGCHKLWRHVLELSADWFLHWPTRFLEAAVQYVRFSLHLGIGVGQQRRHLVSRRARMLWVAALGPGWAVFARDRVRLWLNPSWPVSEPSGRGLQAVPTGGHLSPRS